MSDFVVRLFLKIFIPLAFFLSFTGQSFGQDLSPRDNFIKFLQNYHDDLSISETGLPQDVIREDLIAEEIITVSDDISDTRRPQNIPPEDSTADVLTDDVFNPEEIIIVSNDALNPGDISHNASIPELSVYPFYLSSEDYLKHRGASSQTILNLTYLATATNLKSGLSADAKIIELQIGEDFVAITDMDKIEIFDFKTNRFLTVRTSSNPNLFKNQSLYVRSLRNLNLVKQMTQNGAVDEIKISEELTLDSFWIETSMGWSARHVETNINKDRNQITAKHDDETIIDISLSADRLPSGKHVDSLFAYMHHDMSVHPSILSNMGKIETIPTNLMLISYSPNFSDGRKIVWTLQKSELTQGAIPLPKSAITDVESGRTSAIRFVVSETAKNRTNLITPQALRLNISEAQQSGDALSAWFSSKDLAHRLQGCQNDPAQLCDEIAKLETSDNSDIQTILGAIKALEKGTTRVDGLAALKPYMSTDKTPAFLLKLVGVAAAKIDTRVLPSKIDVASFHPDTLLEEALAKNPYDPELYRFLGQIYATQDRLSDSWDMLDALRVMENVPDVLTDPIETVENSIKAQAPGYFIP